MNDASHILFAICSVGKAILRQSFKEKKFVNGSRAICGKIYDDIKDSLREVV